MIRKQTTLAAAVAIAALAVQAAPAAAATTSSAPYPMRSHTYGKKYCEMGAVFLEGSGVSVDIYNTFAQNSCPTNDWNAATTLAAMNSAKTALGAVQVVTNGPRWWAFDSIGGILGPTVVSFGPLKTNKAAVLKFSTPARPAAYTPFTVQRTSTWVWNKNTYLRVLTAPDGKRYAMQSWTTQISSKVTPSRLNTLASGSKPVITLPPGWSYRAYKAPAKTTIVAPGTMTILQDNVNNVYSLLS
jgi:hypothetical protein